MRRQRFPLLGVSRAIRISSYQTRNTFLTEWFDRDVVASDSPHRVDEVVVVEVLERSPLLLSTLHFLLQQPNPGAVKRQDTSRLF